MNHRHPNNNICWIDIVDYADANGPLKYTYDKVRNADGSLDNLYQAFSLRAHTIKPADDLYLAALHDEHNRLPKHLSELLGTYVAVLTGCEYAYTHHSDNFTHLLDDKVRAKSILDALHSGNLETCGDGKEIAALHYVRKLTLTPAQIVREDVEGLLNAGWDDGEVLEIAQITAMFSYFVRIINGVGISWDGDKIGLY